MDASMWSQADFDRLAEDGAFLVVLWVANTTASPVPEDYLLVLKECEEGELREGIHLGRLSVKDEPALAEMFDLSATPTLMIMRERIVLYCEPGLPDATQFRILLGRIAELDMRQIHAEIAKAREAEISLHRRRVCPTVLRAR